MRGVTSGTGAALAATGTATLRAARSGPAAALAVVAGTAAR
ncbi:hypothetical protein ABZZ37_00445 [Streptomyces sp. NPDC006464]